MLCPSCSLNHQDQYVCVFMHINSKSILSYHCKFGVSTSNQDSSCKIITHLLCSVDNYSCSYIAIIMAMLTELLLLQLQKHDSSTKVHKAQWTRERSPGGAVSSADTVGAIRLLGHSQATTTHCHSYHSGVSPGWWELEACLYCK